MFMQGNHLAECFAGLQARGSFCIGESGFGTGLNFLFAWQSFEQTAQKCGELPPLPADITAASAPLPRAGNKGKCTA